MHYTTQRERSNRHNGYIPITILTLDCGHKLTYFGNPEVAEQMVRENGGSIAGNLSRCYECYQRHQVSVQQIINNAKEQVR